MSRCGGPLTDKIRKGVFEVPPYSSPRLRNCDVSAVAKHMEQTAPCSPTTWTRQFRITLPGSLRWNHNLILYLPALNLVDWIVCGSASCNTSTVNWWLSLANCSILHSQENRVAAVTLRPEVLTMIRKQLLSFINVLWKSMMWIRFANFCGWWLLWTGDFWTCCLW